MSTTDEIMALVDACEDAASVLEAYRGDYEKQLSDYNYYRAALLKAIESIADDAARYRFLRLNYDDSLVMVGGDKGCAEMLMEKELDNAIDSAMQKETP